MTERTWSRVPSIYIRELEAEIERLRSQTNNAIAKQYDAEAEVERLRRELTMALAEVDELRALEPKP